MAVFRHDRIGSFGNRHLELHGKPRPCDERAVPCQAFFGGYADHADDTTDRALIES